MLFYILVGLLPVLPPVPVLIQGDSKVMVQNKTSAVLLFETAM